MDRRRSTLVRRLIKPASQLFGLTFDATPRNGKRKHVFDILRYLTIDRHQRVSRSEDAGNNQSSVHFVTLLDKESLAKGRAEPLLSSYERWGITPVILASYDKKIGNWSKITALQEFLESDAINDDDLLVFTDATDVMVVTDVPPDFSRIIGEYGVDILFGAESRFAKTNLALKPYFEAAYADRGLKYLNTGFVVGRKCHLRIFYGYLHTLIRRLSYVNLNRSDQAVTTYGFVHVHKLQTGIRLGIDHDCRCVATINSTTDLPDKILSPFIHVTSLRDAGQLEKWERLCARFRHGTAQNSA
jgi:hypothetical protein